MRDFTSWDDVNDYLEHECKSKVRMAIKFKCWDCMGYVPGQNKHTSFIHEVKTCTITGCPLYHFRYGNPFKPKRTYTEAQKQKIRERFAQNVKGDQSK